MPVSVSAPEHYAVHRLLLPTMRFRTPRGQAKRSNEVAQASALSSVLLVVCPDELAAVWAEARK
ncbi:GSU2403 family nucleotidyltransferase fold protein [Frigidibacter sp. MR17.24]|uniref:GSU2403 family nucleotidyltransferase fold protein n=1 Tax=Frigidibacter sp. MR17.24 TaxID=3127345 RepID=UPI003FA5445A